MEAITYLNAFDTSTKNGQKLAKISQEKMNALKSKYHEFTSKTVVAPAAFQKEEVASVAPFREVEPMVNNTPVTQVGPSDNYKEIVDAFSLTVYGNSFDEKPLTGARKIRVNPKVVKHAVGLKNRFGNDKIIDITEVRSTHSEMLESASKVDEEVVSRVTTPVVEEVKAETVVPESRDVLPKTTPVVSESVARDISSPSVDDYLQKEVPNQENGIIVQLTGDVEGLKEETVKRAAILEKLEAQYNAIKDQKARRIKELEEEKLSYTATLEGLTEKIRNLQAAIEREEQSLSGYKKAS